MSNAQDFMCIKVGRPNIIINVIYLSDYEKLKDLNNWTMTAMNEFKTEITNLWNRPGCRELLSNKGAHQFRSKTSAHWCILLWEQKPLWGLGMTAVSQ